MNGKEVRIKLDSRYYDAILVDDIVIPMWNTFKHGDIIVTESEDRSVKNIHIVKGIINDYGYMYASTCGKKVVYDLNGNVSSLLKSPHVRIATNNERECIFNMLANEGFKWNLNNNKLMAIN